MRIITISYILEAPPFRVCADVSYLIPSQDDNLTVITIT